jgi:hypothetical protein
MSCRGTGHLGCISQTEFLKGAVRTDPSVNLQQLTCLDDNVSGCTYRDLSVKCDLPAIGMVDHLFRSRLRLSARLLEPFELRAHSSESRDVAWADGIPLD